MKKTENENDSFFISLGSQSNKLQIFKSSSKCVLIFYQYDKYANCEKAKVKYLSFFSSVFKMPGCESQSLKSKRNGLFCEAFESRF